MTENEKPEEKPKLEEKPPIESEHSIVINGKTLRYNVTTGTLPLKNAKDEIEALIFFTAYTLDQPDGAAKRPLVFAFNGGPGSSSVWLHLGALGPKRVRMQDEGWMPAPPFELITNEGTWLDAADLVFVDPVGTGYSRAKTPEDGKNYWNLEGDLNSLCEFIRLYLTRFRRWASPLFLAGESYGTTRVAGLAGKLVDQGVAFNGIVLISTVINFQTILFERGNDLPYALYIPSYAATAWYHGKLSKEFQARDLDDLLEEVEAWAMSDYTSALMRGDSLSKKERKATVSKLAAYTGLSERYIDQTNLRIHILRFDKELLRDENRTVGRLDSRFKGRDALAVTEMPDFDPALIQPMPPYTAMINDYLRGELGYESDLEYVMLSFDVNRSWEWDRGKFPDTSESLRAALAKNPFMQIFVGMGMYDLATPHMGAIYSLGHMDIDPELRKNIHTARYRAGHMYYLDVDSLAQFKADIKKFIKAAISG